MTLSAYPKHWADACRKVLCEPEDPVRVLLDDKLGEGIGRLKSLCNWVRSNDVAELRYRLVGDNLAELFIGVKETNSAQCKRYRAMKKGLIYDRTIESPCRR